MVPPFQLTGEITKMTDSKWILPKCIPCGADLTPSTGKRWTCPQCGARHLVGADGSCVRIFEKGDTLPVRAKK